MVASFLAGHVVNATPVRRINFRWQCSRGGGYEKTKWKVGKKKSMKPEERMQMVLDALQRGLKKDAAKKYERLNESDCLHTQWHYASLITWFGRMHSVDAAEKVFEDSVFKMEPSAMVLNSMLQIYVLHNKPSQVERLVDWMNRKGYGGDDCTIKHMIELAVKYKDLEKAEDLVLSMGTDSKDTQKEAFFMLMEGHRGNAGQIKRIWNRIWNLNLVLTSDDYARLIDELVCCSDFRYAEIVFSAMEIGGIRRTSRVYESMLNLYARLKNLPAVKVYHQFAAFERFDDDVELLNTASRAYLACNDLESSLRVISDLQSKDLAVEDKTAECLAQYYARLGMTEEANEVIDSKVSHISSASLVVLAEACIEKAEFQEARRIIFQIERQYPDTEMTGVYNKIIRGSFLRNDIGQAARWIRRMQMLNVPTSPETFSVILDGYRERCTSLKTLWLLDQLARRSKHMSITTYHNCVGVCCTQCAALDVEKRIVRLMDKHQLNANIGLNLILEAYTTAKELKSAARVTSYMKRKGIELIA